MIQCVASGERQLHLAGNPSGALRDDALYINPGIERRGDECHSSSTSPVARNAPLIFPNAIAELETSQALTVVTDLILNASTIAVDALGASSTRKSLGLDRHWRNVRTLSSHNPRIYKDRIVGDFAVNGTPPPYQWRIGLGG